MKNFTYHYILTTQKDLLQSQALEEILRERSTFFKNRERFKDFWILNCPKFVYDSVIYSKIKNSNFYFNKNKDISHSLNLENNKFDFFSCLISLDKEFMDWVMLRLGDFENINNIPLILEKEKKYLNYTSDGIYGSLNAEEIKINPLFSYKNCIHPNILLDKNKNFLNVYYQLINNDILLKTN